MTILVLNGWAASPEAWSLCDFMKANDVRLFTYLEQLDGEPERTLEALDEAIVVGWSMGASGALRLACRFREKIRGLVLLAPTPRMMEDKATGWIGMSPRRLKAFEMGLKITHGAGFFGPPEGKPNPYMMDTDENLARGLLYLQETDIRADLLALYGPDHPAPFPVFLFHSENDGIVRTANTPFLKERVFPEAVAEIIPGTEHALPILIPEKIDAAVGAMNRVSTGNA